MVRPDPELSTGCSTISTPSWSSPPSLPAAWNPSLAPRFLSWNKKAEFIDQPQSLSPTSTSPRSRSRSRHAPVWENGRLDSRSVVLRAYVLNTGAEWVAIPGGLVRVAEAETMAAGKTVVSMQRGGHSKDAWMLWDGPVDTFSLLRPRNEPVDLRRKDLAPSRAASPTTSSGWAATLNAPKTSRGYARTLVTRVQRADQPELACLLRLHGCLGSRHSKLPKPKRNKPQDPTSQRPRTGTHALSCSPTSNAPTAVASTLHEVARVGGNVRERLSSDMNFLHRQAPRRRP